MIGALGFGLKSLQCVLCWPISLAQGQVNDSISICHHCYCYCFERRCFLLWGVVLGVVQGSGRGCEAIIDPQIVGILIMMCDHDALLSPSTYFEI